MDRATAIRRIPIEAHPRALSTDNCPAHKADKKRCHLREISFHLHQCPVHWADKAGQAAPFTSQYLHGFPILITSSTYWKSMSGTHVNQCIRPWMCGLLQIFKPMLSMRRLKKSSVCTGQQSSVTILKPIALRDT